MKYEGSGKITRQGQVTLPAEGRKELRLKEGDRVEFYASRNMIIVKKKLPPIEIFNALSQEISERFRKKGIRKTIVRKEIEAYREEKHAKA